jgi:predicted HicB family RNase H-like nuclease
MMLYKGYYAKVTFDNDADIFHGEVTNLRDVITFEADCVRDLRQAFHDPVDDYLDFCKQRNEKPEKPFSGKFIVRIDSELLRIIHLRSRQVHTILNRWVADELENAASAKPL